MAEQKSGKNHKKKGRNEDARTERVNHRREETGHDLDQRIKSGFSAWMSPNEVKDGGGASFLLRFRGLRKSESEETCRRPRHH